jgi:hypothetical protein
MPKVNAAEESPRTMAPVVAEGPGFPFSHKRHLLLTVLPAEVLLHSHGLI